MKRTLTIALASLLTGAAAWAAPVTLDRAKVTAQQFMQQRTGMHVTVKDIVAQTDAYYLMNLSPQGWVLVSADDIMLPVLGYSTEDAMTWHNMPDAFRNYLNEGEYAMRYARNAGVTAMDPMWRQISTGEVQVTRAGSDEIQPLITVNWDQGNPYNKFCPGSGSSKALVGCGAVSLSQAMSVQEYPSQAQGQVTYSCPNYGELSIDFDREPGYNWATIKRGSINDDASRLLYHAGMAVRMDYGADGSGVPSNRIDRWTTALSDHFGYNAAELSYHWRDQYRDSWDALVLNELEAGRAVIYNAIDRQGNYGHSFNADGYDGNGMFHINWGWGGYGNGYFSLSALRDDRMGMNYDSNHCVVIGIGSPNRQLRSLALSDNVIDEKLAAGTCVGTILVNGEEPTSKMNLEIIDAEQYPFEIKNNLLVTTQSLTAQNRPYELKVRVSLSGSTEILTAIFPISVVPLRTIAQATAISYDRASGELQVRTRNNTEYKLTGANGAIISEGSLSPIPHLTLKLSDLPEGDNKLTISAGSESKTITIKR